MPLIDNVSKRIKEECKKKGVKMEPFMSSRVT